MADVAYQALADELEREVLRARPGDRLPSEHQLSARHGVSRITTRAALQELERRHLVLRRRGAGTFVALRVDYPISSSIPPSFTETVRQVGHVPGSRVLSARRARPPAQVRDALRLDPGQPVLRVRRIGTIDDQPASLHTSWMARVDLDRVRDQVSDDVSIFALLRDEGCEPAREWYTAELATIPAAAATELGIEGRPQAWRTASCNRCLRTDRLIELAQTWMRADVVRVRFELGPTPTPGGNR